MITLDKKAYAAAVITKSSFVIKPVTLRNV